MEKKFTLGIIGRCLACQLWTHPSDLYHRKLRTSLKENDQITFRVSIAGRSDLEPAERLKILVQKKPIQGVLYHMRHFAGEQRLVNPKKSSPEKKGYHLNPLVYKYFSTKKETSYRDPNWVESQTILKRDRYAKCPFDTPPEKEYRFKTKFLGIPVGKINLILGKFCGLNHLAFESEWTFLERLRRVSLELALPLFVLGPIPRVDALDTKKRADLWKEKCSIASSRLTKYKIPSFFLDSIETELRNSIYMKDEIHLTPEGHRYLATKLYPLVSNWIQSI